MGFLAKIDRLAGDFAGGLQGGMQFGAQIGQMRQESQRYAAQERRYSQQADEQQKGVIRQQATNGDRNALTSAQRYGQEFVNEIQATLARPGQETQASIGASEANLKSLTGTVPPIDPAQRAQLAGRLDESADALRGDRAAARAKGELYPPAQPPQMRGAPGPAGTLPAPGVAAGIGAPAPKPAMPARTGPMMPEVMNKIDPIAAAKSRAAGIRFVDTTRSNILSTALTADSQTIWDQLDELKTAYQQEGRKPEEAEAITRTLKQHITAIRDEAALDALMKAEGDAEATRDIIERFGTLNPWVISIGEARVRKEALSRQGQANQQLAQAFDQFEIQMKLAMSAAQGQDATAAGAFLDGAVASIEGAAPDIAARVLQGKLSLINSWTPMNPVEMSAKIRTSELNDPNWIHIAAQLAKVKYQMEVRENNLTGRYEFLSGQDYAKFVQWETGQLSIPAYDPRIESRSKLEEYAAKSPVEQDRMVKELNARAAGMDDTTFALLAQPFIEASWSVQGKTLIPPPRPNFMDTIAPRLPQSAPAVQTPTSAPAFEELFPQVP